MSKNVELVVQEIVALLVDQEYETLESRTHGVRIPAVEIKEAVESYGRKLVIPPSDAYETEIDKIKVASVNPERWSVTMPLWTEEEGRSDLTLELTVIFSEENVSVELDDLHVL